MEFLAANWTYLFLATLVLAIITAVGRMQVAKSRIGFNRQSPLRAFGTVIAIGLCAVVTGLLCFIGVVADLAGLDTPIINNEVHSDYDVEE